MKGTAWNGFVLKTKILSFVTVEFSTLDGSIIMMASSSVNLSILSLRSCDSATKRHDNSKTVDFLLTVFSDIISNLFNFIHHTLIIVNISEKSPTDSPFFWHLTTTFSILAHLPLGSHLWKYLSETKIKVLFGGLS